MGKKITQLATITEVADDDLLIGVDVSDTSGSDDGTNKKFTKASLLGGYAPTGDIVGTTDTQTLTNKTIDGDDNTLSDISPSSIKGGLDGWIPAEETWTYASATTITVPSGAASKYQKGDKVKITNNSTTKYFYIVGVADTVLTVTGGTDYTVHDSAITNPFFSKIENPQGFPHWFNTSFTWGASTTNPSIGNATINTSKFTVRNGSCLFIFDMIMGSSTTYGSGYWTITVPVPATATRACMGNSIGIPGGGTNSGSGNPYLIDGTKLVIDGSTVRGNFSSTVPFTWGSNHTWRCQIEYPI